MPLDLQTAITNGRRPTPADRWTVIRVLAEEIRKVDPNPTRSQCRIVGLKIVRQYPKSFADFRVQDEATMVREGYGSILEQLKVRIENLNRCNTLARRRSFRAGTGPGTTTKRGLYESYGCTQWQPQMPPV